MPEHEEDYDERRREREAGAREREGRRERFGRQVDEAESDWEGKQTDQGVPSAQDPEQKLVVDDEVKKQVIEHGELREEPEADEPEAEEREGDVYLETLEGEGEGEGEPESETAGAEGEPERE